MQLKFPKTGHTVYAYLRWLIFFFRLYTYAYGNMFQIISYMRIIWQELQTSLLRKQERTSVKHTYFPLDARIHTLLIDSSVSLPVIFYSIDPIFIICPNNNLMFVCTIYIRRTYTQQQQNIQCKEHTLHCT